ncbi:Lanosterol synthase (Oxidosqualene--lanosterol cyclase) [Sorochytrium milnesiophthora]
MTVLPTDQQQQQQQCKYPPSEEHPLHRWRLDVCDGRQTWAYDADKTAMTDAEAYWLGLLSQQDERQGLHDHAKAPETLTDAARQAMRFVSRLQTDDGHWAGEYGGPMFLIPGFVVVWYITGRRSDVLDEHQQREIIRYLRCRETAGADGVLGGWGIHIESPSTMFGTALNYVVMRLLGVSENDETCVRARAFIRKNGGAVTVPTWGKFWLALLGCYSWDGMNAVQPETWLLPYSVPAHPGRMWVHTRMVYLAMSYFYGRKLSAPVDDLTQQLRQELYLESYESIEWSTHRTSVCELDRYVAANPVCATTMSVLGVYESWFAGDSNSFLRKRAIAHVKQLMYNEDDNTDFLCLAPVNKPMNMLATWYEEGPDSDRFKRHCFRMSDALWMSQDGMMVNGTNGSQLWDAVFFCQAAVEAGIAEEAEFKQTMCKALDFVDKMQIRRNAPKDTYRHQSLGAWPFSTRDQSYTVSDCTAEGLKTVILLQKLPSFPKPVTNERMFQAVDVLLSMQNKDGGIGSYELIRGPALLELLNPAELFGNIMIEYSYVECTTACVLGLATFSKLFPAYRTKEIRAFVDKAVAYIKSKQRADGSWYGSWAICFTYAAWFSLESLATAGETYENSDAVRRACDFLVSKQMYDGGWGESYKSCESQVYTHHEKSQVVNTCWAVMALMAGNYPNESVIRRGLELILSRQQPSGEWKQEAIEGVFNKNCMISYPNYKLAFPIWAIGKYTRLHGNKSLLVEKNSEGSRVRTLIL